MKTQLAQLDESALFFFDKVFLAATRREVFARNSSNQSIVNHIMLMQSNRQFESFWLFGYSDQRLRNRQSRSRLSLSRQEELSDETEADPDIAIPFSRLTRVLCVTNMSLGFGFGSIDGSICGSIELINGMGGTIVSVVEASLEQSLYFVDSQIKAILTNPLFSQQSKKSIALAQQAYDAFVDAHERDRRVPLVLFDTGILCLVPYVFETEGFRDSRGNVHVTKAEIHPGVVHGWALTIHKAQGSTLDSAIFSFDHSFVESQVYVGLSRVRSADHVWITGRIPYAQSKGLLISPEVTIWEHNRLLEEWHRNRKSHLNQAMDHHELQ